ncbi:hypothetical protein pb186bvf_002135 [Paramecium bursaria]
MKAQYLIGFQQFLPIKCNSIVNVKNSNQPGDMILHHKERQFDQNQIQSSLIFKQFKINFLQNQSFQTCRGYNMNELFRFCYKFSNKNKKSLFRVWFQRKLQQLIEITVQIDSVQIIKIFRVVQLIPPKSSFLSKATIFQYNKLQNLKCFYFT